MILASQRTQGNIGRKGISLRLAEGAMVAQWQRTDLPIQRLLFQISALRKPAEVLRVANILLLQAKAIMRCSNIEI